MISAHALLWQQTIKEVAYIAEELRILQADPCPGSPACQLKIKAMIQASENSLEAAELLWRALGFGKEGDDDCGRFTIEL